MSIKKMSRTNQLYLSGGLVLAAMMGFALLEAVAWGALWIWNRDFVRALGKWFVKCVMLGLAGAALFQYALGRLVDLPDGFTAGALVALGLAAGLYGERRGRG